MKYYNLLLILSLVLTIAAQDTLKYKLDDVIVTSSAAPVTFSNLSRTVNLITQKEIEASNASSVDELMQYTSGVDLRQRGVEGMQSDLAIRGGTFEQTLVLINGIKVIDPQTGHHNLDLPFSLNDVSRIEILKGPGSRIFGANAFSGAVNIITKKNYQNSLSVLLRGGENGYYKQGLSGSFGLSNLSNGISFDRTKSNGYTHNTEFETINFSYQAALNMKPGSVNLLFGYNDKEFGANSFYGSLYPEQWEHTTTKLLNLSGEFGKNRFIISPKAYWRRSDDDYVLDRTNRSYYENIHKTDVYGLELSSSYKSSIGTTSMGLEYSKDNITSTNLGDHEREKKGFFLEQLFSPFENFSVNAGAFVYKYDKIDWKVWPGIDLSYNVNGSLRFYTSYGKAFRIPTFTELYYNSPVNIGNANLESEETTNYELGFYLNKDKILLNGAVFYKDGKNIIDWFRTSVDDPWEVRNISKIKTTGFELSLEYNLNVSFINYVSFGYTYLNSDKESESFDSRYFLEYLRHQAVIKINNDLPFSIDQSWSLRYEDRLNYADYFIVDTKISRAYDNFVFGLSANNLFDNEYIDISGIMLPGRWIKAEIRYSLTNL